MRIFTHYNPNLDTACSVWAATRFIPGAKGASVILRLASWNGEEMEAGDLALDMEAGGRGIKSEKDAGGAVRSCFETLVQRHASPEDRIALAELVGCVNLCGSRGAVMEAALGVPLATRSILAETSLAAVLRALKTLRPNDDWFAVSRMFVILDGLLEWGRRHQHARQEAGQAEFFAGTAVALVRNVNSSISPLFHEHGARVVVYTRGNNTGVVRRNGERVRMDHPSLRAIVAAVGEADEWFAHPNGFLYSRGSIKMPAASPSKVNPRALAKAVAEILA